MFYYSLNLLIMQNSDAEHRTCTASQYTQLHEKNNAQYKSKYITSHSAKQNWKGKKNCYHYHSSSQRSLSPFWFQLLTIFSSFIGRDFYHRQLLVFRIVKIKITIVTLITSYTNLATLKLLSILHVSSWHSDLSLHLWGPWSLNVLTMFFVFLWVRRPACYENTQCYFSVGLPRTVCAFVRLILDNILEQYVPQNTVAKFYPNCFLLFLLILSKLLLWKISDQMYHWTWLPSLTSDKFCA